MAKFRKKPVVIEASQWHQNGDHPEDGTEVFEDGEFKRELLEGKVVRYFRNPDRDGQDVCKHCGEILHEHGWIDTLEGGHVVCPGDYIITGVRGERYPCKPEIFTETYEEVFTFNKIPRTLRNAQGYDIDAFKERIANAIFFDKPTHEKVATVRSILEELDIIIA